MLLRERNPNFSAAQTSVKLCFYTAFAATLKLKGIGVTLLAQYCLPFPT